MMPLTKSADHQSIELPRVGFGRFVVRLLRFFLIAWAITWAFHAYQQLPRWRTIGVDFLLVTLAESAGMTTAFYAAFSFAAVTIGTIRFSRQGGWPDWRFLGAPALLWIIIMAALRFV